jgi:hypothetical protein
LAENTASWQGEPFLTQKPLITPPRVFEPQSQEDEKVF